MPKANLNEIQNLLNDGVPPSMILTGLYQDEELRPKIDELTGLNATPDQILQGFIALNEQQNITPQAAPDASVPSNGAPLGPEVTPEVPALPQPEPVPEDSIEISVDAYRRILLNRDNPPEQVEAEIQRVQQMGGTPTIQVKDLSDVMGQALRNFLPDFMDNVKANVNVLENIPAMMRLGAEAFALQATPVDSAAGAITTLRGAERQQEVFEQSSINQLLEFYAQTYDIFTPEGREVLKDFIANHPSQFLSDAAVILGPAGAMALRTGRIAPIVNRLNSTRFVKPLATAAKVAIDPGELVDIGRRRLGSALSPPLSEDINQNMLGLQAKLQEQVPGGFPRGIVEGPVAASEEAARIKTGIFGNARRRLERFDTDINRLADSFIERFGGVKDVGTIGETVFKGFNQTIDRFQKHSERLFGQVEGIWDKPGNYGHTIATIDAILEDNRGAITRNATDIKRLRNIRDELQQDIDEGNLTVKDIDRQRTGWRELSKTDRRSENLAITPRKVSYQIAVYNALTDDLYGAVRDAEPRMETLLRRSKEIYRDAVKRLNTRYGDKILSLGDDGRFDELTKELQKPSYLNRKDVEDLLTNVGPEGAMRLRAIYLQNLLDGTRTRAGNFTPTGLAGKLQNTDNVVTKMIIGREAFETLEDIAQIMLESQDLQKALGGSQTAWNLDAISRMFDKFSVGTSIAAGGAAQLMDALTGGGTLMPEPTSMAFAAATFFGRETYKAFLDSEFARKWVQRGFDFPGIAEIDAIGRAIKRTPRGATRAALRGAVVSEQERLRQFIPEQTQETIRPQRQE